MASVSKRGNKYCVRYRYETDTGEIREKRVSGFSSKEDAWAAARDLEMKSSAGIDVHGDTMTCAEVMERWFADHCGSLAVNTRAKYSAAIDKLSGFFIADMQIRRLDSRRFNLLLSQLQENVSVRTAVSNTEPLRLALSWAVAERLIPFNPLANVSLPKVPKRTQRILTDADAEDLVSMSVASNRRCTDFHIPLILALYGGLRREECAGLRWEDVDFDHNRLTISHVVTMTPDGTEHHKEPKTDLSARTVSMPSLIMAELESAYQVFLSRPNTHTLQHNPLHRVCVTSVGDPYSCKSYAHALLRLIREVNAQREASHKPRMPEASFRDLRHTHVAMLIRMNVQPKVISERLGHSSIKMTMDTYGYLMPGLQDAVADLFNQKYESRNSSAG